MGARDDLYRQFGPQLLEAVVMILKDEINILRVEAGLPERTNAQLITGIENKLAGLGDYDWTPNLDR